MREFQVGDHCRVRGWDDMVAEFGIDKDGDIKTDPGALYFVSQMRDLCGCDFHISRVMRIDDNFGGLNRPLFRYFPSDEDDPELQDWNFTTAMLELADDDPADDFTWQSPDPSGLLDF